MKEYRFPSREQFEKHVLIIKEVAEEKTPSFLDRIFGLHDKADKTTVFDQVDNVWFDYMHKNIAKVSSDFYSDDGSVEHRIAYICVDLNLLHGLPNGNKRSSLLALFILLYYNAACEKSFEQAFETMASLNWDYLYLFTKRVAAGGVAGRDEHIEELREYLKGVVRA